MTPRVTTLPYDEARRIGDMITVAAEKYGTEQIPTNWTTGSFQLTLGNISFTSRIGHVSARMLGHGEVFQVGGIYGSYRPDLLDNWLSKLTALAVLASIETGG